MRIIDRLFEYLKHHRLTPYTFEQRCGIANGYLKKQSRGKGSIGSEILEKIVNRYRDIEPEWLLTGRGTMLRSSDYPPAEDQGSQMEDAPVPPTDYLVRLLRDKTTILENALRDKEKIIVLLEERVSNFPQKPDGAGIAG